MPKAFARVPASAVQAYLDGDLDELPRALETALEEAVKNARKSVEFDGQAPIQVFIIDDSDDKDEDEE